MKIIIEEYNPVWKTLFEEEKRNILEALSGIQFEIEHIGSTAVDGLGAKPVIDILIGLNNFSEAGEQVKKIVNIGYQYISKYEDTMPYRRFFIKEKFGVRTHHIHMVKIHTEFWERHIAFRDYLRKHPEEKLAYYDLKKQLALREWRDGNEYAAAKTEFIRRIEKKIIHDNK